MQNLLIVEDDLIQAHFLANAICREISNIRLYNIATTGNEAINIIKEESIDIIVLDLKLPDMSGIDIIDFISKNNMSKYDSSIIILTGEMELLKKTIGNKCIYSYSSKINGLGFIIEKLENLISEKQKINYIDSIKEQIQTELNMLKFDFSYIGTKLLYESIYECYCKTNMYDINLNKDIYPIISKKYHKNINSIRTSIFQSISMMYYEIEEEKLSNYFGYKIIRKPKTKDIIFAIL